MTDEETIIEAAAQALCDIRRGFAGAWTTADPLDRQVYRIEARAVLDAGAAAWELLQASPQPK